MRGIQKYDWRYCRRMITFVEWTNMDSPSMKTDASPRATLPKRPLLKSAITQRQVASRVSQRATSRDRTRTESSGVGAVDRALAILGAFQPGDTALPLCEISQRCNLYNSTVLRIAQSLLRGGYLQRLEDGSYQIGPTPLILGALYQRSVKLGDLLLPLMRELVDQTGESMSIYVRNGDVRVCLHRIDSKHAVRDNVREGDVLPLERGSGGRVLLAFSGAQGEPYETIRTEHCYTSVGELDTETAGISVPFFGTGQVIGAMSLSGPRSRIDERFIANARVRLLRAAARATNSLGGDASAINQSLAAILAGKRRIKRELPSQYLARR
jgi:DNA-binding IclR family transcriptional regulator